MLTGFCVFDLVGWVWLVVNNVVLVDFAYVACLMVVVGRYILFFVVCLGFCGLVFIVVSLFVVAMV